MNVERFIALLDAYERAQQEHGERGMAVMVALAQEIYRLRGEEPPSNVRDLLQGVKDDLQDFFGSLATLAEIVSGLQLPVSE